MLEIETCNDLHVRAYVQGDEVTCYILLHGLGDCAGIWDGFCAALPRAIQTIAVDLRGHGVSDWNSLARYQIDDYADDIICIIKHLRAKRICLIGHSLGARIALGVASREPAIIDKLILIELSQDLDRAAQIYLLRTIEQRIGHFDSLQTYTELLEQQYALVDFDRVAEFARGSAKFAGTKWTAQFDPKMDSAIYPNVLNDFKRVSTDIFLEDDLPRVACDGTLSGFAKVAEEYIDAMLALYAQLNAYSGLAKLRPTFTNVERSLSPPVMILKRRTSNMRPLAQRTLLRTTSGWMSIPWQNSFRV